MSESTAALRVVVRRLAHCKGRRSGPLERENGYPTDATATKIFDEIDYQRACQAYLWALPLMSMQQWQSEHLAQFGAAKHDYVDYLTFQDKLGLLTANATTPYIMAFPNLKATTSVLPLEDFSGLAFREILRTSSSPTILAEKAMRPILGRVGEIESTSLRHSTRIRFGVRTERFHETNRLSERTIPILFLLP